MSKRFGEIRKGWAGDSQIWREREREREGGWDVSDGWVNIFFLTVLVKSFRCAFTVWEMMCVYVSTV